MGFYGWTNIDEIGRDTTGPRLWCKNDRTCSLPMQHAGACFLDRYEGSRADQDRDRRAEDRENERRP